MVKQQTAAEKVRKKKWFPVLAPKFFHERVIGEIPLYESSSMLKRSLTVNMMNLTGDPKSQHINVMVRINDVKEGKGLTEILGYTMMPSSVKRFIRRDKTKIEDSLVVVTSDKKNVRIKPLVLTNSMVNASVATSIRNKVRNNLARFVARITYDKLIEEIVTYKLQKYLGGLANQITPLRNFEIRAFKLVEREDVVVYKPAREEETKREEDNIPEEEQGAKEKKEGQGEESEEEGEVEAEEAAESVTNEAAEEEAQ